MAISRDAPQDISLITEPVNRLDDPTDREQSTILNGQEALQRLGRDLTWPDWPHVGAALVNRPVGRRYNVLFAAWLSKFGFANIDKADRSRLFAVMDHLGAIETWRTSLPPAERLRLNHPSAVFRRWKSANAIAPNQNSRLSPIKKCREEKGALQQEILRLRRECERFAGDHWDPAARPDDIAAAMVAKLGRNKAAAVAGAILKVLEGKAAQ